LKIDRTLHNILRGSIAGLGQRLEGRTSTWKLGRLHDVAR
jgi:hypothetical protein